jgi:hypothetical protein
VRTFVAFIVGLIPLVFAAANARIWEPGGDSIGSGILLVVVGPGAGLGAGFAAGLVFDLVHRLRRTRAALGLSLGLLIIGLIVEAMAYHWATISTSTFAWAPPPRPSPRLPDRPVPLIEILAVSVASLGVAGLLAEFARLVRKCIGGGMKPEPSAPALRSGAAGPALDPRRRP